MHCIVGLEEKEPCRCGLHLTSPAPWTRIVGKFSENPSHQYPNLGLHQMITAIAGGAFVQYPHKYPWQIALLYSKYPKSPKAKFKLKCGASIIGPKTILTAAHCVVDLSPTEIRVQENLVIAYQCQWLFSCQVGCRRAQSGHCQWSWQCHNDCQEICSPSGIWQREPCLRLCNFESIKIHTFFQGCQRNLSGQVNLSVYTRFLVAFHYFLVNRKWTMTGKYWWLLDGALKRLIQT